ncbi:ADP-dependent glucokinase/phosphofructokinase [Microbacterium hydrocarbonoxydans]|uniref:ADP-dependent glucokinase/phosphofructokinase n=1 Tax=Microbacterium hydrocarbonoxydans TaxID=273678 RepID=UPI00203D3E55|nr:ADP-dependent glucokinase/phosphofructokinase [Microbacterium hydrocarbonoxydans]MCM3779599.1 ADP-dependent glucokinase/phosphofructokinase [Microbacterium hydrocarbonoxydans]
MDETASRARDGSAGVPAGTLVLGLGGTVDYELTWDAAVIERLAQEHGVRRSELTTTAPIVDERSLLLTVLAFVDSGAGAERFVASSDIVERFAAHFSFAATLGGTGVRAGLVLDALGIPSIQHLVSIDDTVRRLLPPAITYVSSAAEDTLDPHLIVQYPAGTRVQLDDGVIVAPASNRLIFANDPPNRSMVIAPALADELARARIFLVSGFNTMQDHDLLEQRLDDVTTAMASLPPEALVYYEDAGFYTREFAATVRSRLLSLIDVYGMNEDELQEYLGRDVDLLDAADVARALAEVRQIVPAATLVVHTRYWAIAVGEAAHRHRSALASAVVVAATRYRVGDALTAADVDQTQGMPQHSGGADVVGVVEQRIEDAVGVPAFDLDVATPTTIGLGDTFVGGFLAGVVTDQRQQHEQQQERP